MLGHRIATLARSAVMGGLLLTGAPLASGQPAPGPTNLGEFELKYQAMLKSYEPVVQAINAEEAARVKANKGTGQGEWLAKLESVHQKSDQEFASLLKAAAAANPPQALIIYNNWLRNLQILNVSDPAIVQDIDAIAPTPQRAAQYAFDALVKKCNGSNAMEVAPEFIEPMRVAAMYGDIEIPDAAAKQIDCRNKATLTLGFDAEIEGENFGYFPKWSAHIRATNITLTWNPKLNQFQAKRVPVEYVSYDFTKRLPCDEAHGVSGTISAYVAMTRSPGEPRQYDVQIFPVTSELLKHPEFRGSWGADRMYGRGCPHLKEEHTDNAWQGFVWTDGASPMLIRLGSTAEITGTPYVDGIVRVTRTTTIALRGGSP